jgi:hypothetical protein
MHATNKALFLGLLVLVLGGCAPQDSPAPGCRRGGLMGGCFGKTAIVDLQVQPEIACLEVEANNCNGGVLDVYHTCTETLVLDGIQIPPSEPVTLDVTLTPEGDYSLVEVYSNFSEITPEEDLPVTITGTVGDRPLEITFVKTRPLCE